MSTRHPTTQKLNCYPSLAQDACRLPINITVNNHTIPPSDQVRYLGIQISSNLSWSDHIRATCKTTKCHLGLIHHKFHQAPAKLRHQIYRSTILPKLEYCSAVWDPHLVKDIQALESVHKFAGRIILNDWKLSYDWILLLLKWHPLQVRTILNLRFALTFYITSPVFLPLLSLNTLTPLHVFLTLKLFLDHL